VSEFCRTCRFFFDRGERAAWDRSPRTICRRFPSFEARESGDWCGEHSPRDGATVSAGRPRSPLREVAMRRRIVEVKP
jgi:hypothetical protein